MDSQEFTNFDGVFFETHIDMAAVKYDNKIFSNEVKDN